MKAVRLGLTLASFAVSVTTLPLVVTVLLADKLMPRIEDHPFYSMTSGLCYWCGRKRKHHKDRR